MKRTLAFVIILMLCTLCTVLAQDGSDNSDDCNPNIYGECQGPIEGAEEIDDAIITDTEEPDTGTSCTPTGLGDNCEIPPDIDTSGKRISPCYDNDGGTACTEEWVNVVAYEVCNGEYEPEVCNAVTRDGQVINPQNPDEETSEESLPDEDTPDEVETPDEPSEDGNESNEPPCYTPNEGGCEGEEDATETDCVGTPEQCENVNTDNDSNPDNEGEESDINPGNEANEGSAEAEGYQTSCGNNLSGSIQDSFNAGVGIYESGKGLAGELGFDTDQLGGFDDVLDDAGGIIGDVSNIIGISEEVLCLLDDFSVSGLAAIVCAVEGQPQEGEEAGTGCKISTTVEEWREIIQHSNNSIFTTADDLFGSLMSSGLVKVSKGDQRAVSAAFDSFENFRKNTEGNASIKDIFDAGKQFIQESKQIALADTTGNDTGGPGFAAAKRFRIGEEYKLKEYGLSSFTTERAAEKLADQSVKLTAESEAINKEFADTGIDRQEQSAVAVSSRAELSVVLSALTDIQWRQMAIDNQVLKQMTLQNESSVLTVKELAKQTQIMLREAEEEFRIAQANDNAELREVENQVFELSKNADGLAKIFYIAAGTGEIPAQEETQ